MEDTNTMGSLGSDGGLMVSDADDEADDDEEEEDEGYVDQSPSRPASPDIGRGALYGYGREPLASFCKMPQSLLGQHFYTPQGRALLRSHSWDETWYGRVVKQVADKACSLKMAGMTCPFCSDETPNHHMDIFGDELQLQTYQESLNSSSRRANASDEQTQAQSYQSGPGERGMPLIDRDELGPVPAGPKTIVKPVPRMGICATERREYIVSGHDSRQSQKSWPALYDNVPVPPERISSRDTSFRSLAMMEATSVPELSSCLPPDDNIRGGTEYLLQRFLDNIEEEAMLLEVIDDCDHPPMAKEPRKQPIANAKPSKLHPSKKHNGQRKGAKAETSNGVSATVPRPGKVVQSSGQSDESGEVFEVAVPPKGRKRSRARRVHSRHRRFLSTCHVFRSAFLDNDPRKLLGKTVLATTTAQRPQRAQIAKCELPHLCHEVQDRQIFRRGRSIQQEYKLAPVNMKENCPEKYSSCYEIPQLCYQDKQTKVQDRPMQTEFKPKVNPYRVSTCTIALSQTNTVTKEDQAKVSTWMDDKSTKPSSVGVSPKSSDPTSSSVTCPSEETMAAPSTIKIMAPGQVELSMSTTKAVSVFGKSTGDENGVEFSIQLHDQVECAQPENVPQWEAYANSTSSIQVANGERFALPSCGDAGDLPEDDAMYSRDTFLRKRAMFANGESKVASDATSKPKRLSDPRLRSAEAMLRDVLRARKPPGHPGDTIKHENNAASDATPEPKMLQPARIRSAEAMLRDVLRARNPPGAADDTVKRESKAPSDATAKPKGLPTARRRSAEAMLGDVLRSRKPPGHQVENEDLSDSLIGTVEVNSLPVASDHPQRDDCHRSSEPEPTLEKPVYAAIYRAQTVDVATPPRLKFGPASKEVSPQITRPTRVMNVPRCFGDRAGPTAGITTDRDGNIRHVPTKNSNSIHMPTQDLDVVDLRDYFSIRHKVLEAKHLMDEVFDVINKNGTAAGVGPCTNAPKNSQTAIYNNSSLDTTPASGGSVNVAGNGRGHKAGPMISKAELVSQAVQLARNPTEPDTRQYRVLDPEVTGTGTEIVEMPNTGTRGVQNSHDVSALQSSREIGMPGVDSGGALAMHQTKPKWKVCETLLSSPAAVNLSHSVELEEAGCQLMKPTRDKYAVSGYANDLTQNESVEHANGALRHQSSSTPDTTALDHLTLEQVEADGSEPKLIEGEDTEVSTILQAEIKMAASPDDVMPTSVHTGTATSKFGTHDQFLQRLPVNTCDSNVQTDSPYNMREETSDGWVLKQDMEDGKPLFRPIVAEMSLHEIHYHNC